MEYTFVSVISVTASIIFMIVQCGTKKSPKPVAPSPSVSSSSCVPRSAFEEKEAEEEGEKQEEKENEANSSDESDFNDYEPTNVISHLETYSSEPRSVGGDDDEEDDGRSGPLEDGPLKLRTNVRACGKDEIRLDSTNMYLRFCVLDFKEGNDIDALLYNAKVAGDQAASYHWNSKKQLDFDESSWKHLARRISYLQAMGFDIRANTLKERQKREQILSADANQVARKSRLADLMMNRQKPKNKGKTAKKTVKTDVP